MEPAPYRQACDRCHTQKLRCKREPDRSGGACYRCFKAKVQCVSSPSLRVRRNEERQSENSNSNKRHGRQASDAGTPSAFLDTLSIDPISVDPMMETVLDFPPNGLTLPWSPNAVMNDLNVVPGTQDDEVGSIPSTLPGLDGTATLAPSSLTVMSPFDMGHDGQQHESLQHDSWIFHLSQINVELYQHSISLQRLESTGQQRNWPFDQTLAVAHRLLRILNEMPSQKSSSTGQQRNWPFDQTLAVAHRLLRILNEMPSQKSSSADSGTVLLIFSCYLRLQQIHASLVAYLESVDLKHTAASAMLPSMSIGCFELVAHSPVYLPFIISLSQSLLSQIGDAVNRVGGSKAELEDGLRRVAA